MNESDIRGAPRLVGTHCQLEPPIEPSPRTLREDELLHREVTGIRRLTLDIALKSDHRGPADRQRSALQRVDREAAETALDPGHNHPADARPIRHLLLTQVPRRSSGPQFNTKARQLLARPALDFDGECTASGSRHDPVMIISGASLSLTRSRSHLSRRTARWMCRPTDISCRAGHPLAAFAPSGYQRPKIAHGVCAGGMGRPARMGRGRRARRTRRAPPATPRSSSRRRPCRPRSSSAGAAADPRGSSPR